MSAKKNKAKTLSKKKGVDIWHFYNIPPEIIELLRNKRRRFPLVHFLGHSEPSTIKSWVPETSRCNRRNVPELYLLGKSSNTSSASTSRGKTRIRKAAMDDGRVTVYCTGGPWWVGYKCTTPDPFDPKNRRIEFSNIVGFQGRYYAVSTQGALAVLQSIDSRLVITDIGRSRVVPSANSRFFKECLFELDGEIMLVLFVYRKSIESVDEVEVYSLDGVKLDWVKVERIQGKTVFLGERWNWVNSGEVGCRGDCVFFTQGSHNGWWVYDMESCFISPASMVN
ncbi:hypothetical protein ACS0TY_013476 [Phlomoides rotata]